MYRHVPVFPPATHVHFPDREIGYVADVRPGRCGRTPIPVSPAAAEHRRPKRTGAALGAGNHLARESHVNKISISKRHRPASGPLEPLPADPRDRDIVRAKQLAVRSRPPGATPRARDAEPGQGFACAEDRHA